MDQEVISRVMCIDTRSCNLCGNGGQIGVPNQRRSTMVGSMDVVLREDSGNVNITRTRALSGSAVS